MTMTRTPAHYDDDDDDDDVYFDDQDTDDARRSSDASRIVVCSISCDSYDDACDDDGCAKKKR
jgi:hypothetical protein